MSFEKTTKIASSTGMSLGATIAVVISWSLYQSVLWAVIHGIFGWFYIIYYLITKSGG